MDSKPAVVLSVRDVRKKIGRKWIIKGVSFDIREGEVFGFLGPNGSGKTTTIRMLVGLIRPTDGSISVCGKDVQQEHNAALLQIGSIVENPDMYGFMTGWENLEHFAAMMPNITEQRLHEVVRIVGLKNRIHDKVKTYSLGMKQRLGIAQALLGKPKLLILDEPTNGLDPQGIKELRDFVRLLADQGMSLFISSHLLSEIQMLCDRVAIISRGQVIAVGGVDELLQQSKGRVLWQVDQFETAIRLLTETPEIETLREDQAGDLSEVSQAPGSRLIVAQMPIELIPEMNRKLVKAGVGVFSVQVKNPSLEGLFLSLTEGESID
ncbi:ABC transporter ATP-binding protein [Ferviditalea candida]|uniref:ABC transporter ATP-binding protein n=1 Tax=Ferviditalea candida TaxID=3108399 RepID=A0ABU5ZHK8_9BACL|nr:ABC transporter ATP-binding protein [Paenibacillaceae bacterium T2]